MKTLTLIRLWDLYKLNNIYDTTDKKTQEMFVRQVQEQRTKRTLEEATEKYIYRK